MASGQRIGVISDTHGLLRPEAVRALEGVDRIFHAGDVGDESILPALEEIAPVVAVRGNVDVEPWTRALPYTVAWQDDALSIYMLHDIAALDIDPAAGGFDVVIYGHSHQPSAEMRDGVLYLNPGSAGPRRFTLPITLAILIAPDGVPSAEHITLTDR